jgi:hypothetical protein
MDGFMSKLIGSIFLVALVGMVVAWSRSTGSEVRGDHPLARSGAFSPDIMHSKIDVKQLPVQKLNDMSFVFTERD